MGFDLTKCSLGAAMHFLGQKTHSIYVIGSIDRTIAQCLIAYPPIKLDDFEKLNL